MAENYALTLNRKQFSQIHILDATIQSYQIVILLLRKLQAAKLRLILAYMQP